MVLLFLKISFLYFKMKNQGFFAKKVKRGKRKVISCTQKVLETSKRTIAGF